MRDYLAFGKPKDYDEIQSALHQMNEAHLREVVADLTPARGESQALGALHDELLDADYSEELADAVRVAFRTVRTLNDAAQPATDTTQHASARA